MLASLGRVRGITFLVVWRSWDPGATPREDFSECRREVILCQEPCRHLPFVRLEGARGTSVGENRGIYAHLDPGFPFP